VEWRVRLIQGLRRGARCLWWVWFEEREGSRAEVVPKKLLIFSLDGIFQRCLELSGNDIPCVISMQLSLYLYSNRVCTRCITAD
jgi:hypothetical protein